MCTLTCFGMLVAFCRAKLFQECSCSLCRRFPEDTPECPLRSEHLSSHTPRKTTMAKSVAVFSSGAEQKEQISGYLKFQQVGSFKTTMPQRPFNHFLARLGCGWRVNCNISWHFLFLFHFILAGKRGRTYQHRGRIGRSARRQTCHRGARVWYV